MPKLKSAWDLTFAGTGLMVNREPNLQTPAGRAVPIGLRTTQADYSASRQSTGAQSYANWDPRVQINEVVSDLSSGYAQLMRPPQGGPRRYFYGFVDARIPNKIFLPPQVNSVAVTAEDRIYAEYRRSISGTDTQYICNGRYVQYWTTDPTSVSNAHDSGTGLSHISARTFQGVQSESYTFIGVEVTSGGMPQPYLTHDGSGAAATFAKDAQATTVAPAAGLFSDDGSFTEDDAVPITLTLSSLVAADDAVYVRGLQPYEGLKVTINAANGSSSTITAKYWTGSAWAALSSVSDGTASSGASFGQTGSITWTLPTNWAVNTVNSTAGYHVQLTFNNNFDSSVSTADIDLIQRDTALVFETHGDRLFCIRKQANGNYLFSTQNGGTNATWAQVGLVTSHDNPVTNMVSGSGRLFIFAERNFYALGTDGTTISEDRWPDPFYLRSSTNAIGASIVRGRIWVPAGAGLYQVEEASGYIRVDDLIGPGALPDNSSPVTGAITCVAADKFFAYAVLQDASGASFLLSRNHQLEKWHTLLSLGNITSRFMWVADIGHSTNPVLYFSAGNDTRYIILPRNSPDPTSDSACRFDTATTNVGVLYLGRFTSPQIFENKIWLQGRVQGEDLSSTETAALAYRSTDDGSWTGLATFNTDPGDEQNFTGTLASKFLELRLTLASGSTSTTPVIRQVAIDFAVRFPQKLLYEWAVVLEDHQVNRTGVERTDTASDVKTAIETAMASSTAVTLYDEHLDESVEVVPQDYEAVDVLNAEGENVSYVALCTAARHQGTVFGTWARMASYTWGDLATYTWSELTSI
jgi:hypothetical protein